MTIGDKPNETRRSTAHGASRLEIMPRMEPLLAAAGIRSIEDALETTAGEIVASSRSSSVRRLPAGSSRVYVKVLTYPTVKDVALRLLSRRALWHRVRREWRSIALQEALGLPAVQRVCFGEVRKKGFLRAAMLMTEEVAGAMGLDAWLRREHRGADAVDGVGAYVARLHRAGFHHGDLNARNVLIRAEDVGTLALWNVDSGRGRRCPWHGRLTAEHVRDVAPLALAFRVILGNDAMQAFGRAYASHVGCAISPATARMLEAEMLEIEARETRRLS